MWELDSTKIKERNPQDYEQGLSHESISNTNYRIQSEVNYYFLGWQYTFSDFNMHLGVSTRTFFPAKAASKRIATFL